MSRVCLGRTGGVAGHRPVMGARDLSRRNVHITEMRRQSPSRARQPTFLRNKFRAPESNSDGPIGRNFYQSSAATRSPVCDVLKTILLAAKLSTISLRN